jgi:hypothetical protein
MKSKHLFQIFVLLTLLFSPFGINQQVRASTGSVDQSVAFQSQPMVSMSVSPASINMGEMATVTVSLNNVPSEGYSSVELTCTYYPNLVEASNILVANLFGADPAIAIKGPQYDRFIVAIAGSTGNKATSGGTVLTFSVRGLQAGQSPMECQARVAKGDNVLNSIASTGNNVIVLAPTPTSTTGFCDSAEFVADVNVPPGTLMTPGAQFTKTWRLKNIGSCTWTTSYQMVFFSGEQMNAPASIPFSGNVAPGQTVDLSLNLTAPSAAGSYRGGWMFKNASGTLFGTGPQANEPWFVDIAVSNTTGTPPATFTPSPTLDTNTLTVTATPSPTGTISQTPGTPTDTPVPGVTPGGPTASPVPGTVYDFVASMCSATWFSGAGQLPCPGIDGNPNGFVFKLDHPQLENGGTNTPPGLLTFPQNAQIGYIQGFYPSFHVQSGDRFRSVLSCEFGATGCYVAFRLDYQVGTESIKTLFGPFLERYDGIYYTADVDLSSLAGKDVKFILTLLASGQAAGDRAMWVGPIIYRADGISTPTATVSSTPTVGVSPTPVSTLEGGWIPFQVNSYGFRFLYPSQAQLLDGSRDNYARINLPFAPGTNLSQKYLEMYVTENADPCRSPLATDSMVETSETVVINGLSFLKETGEDGTAGHINKWTAYSTSRNNACVSLDFILRAANPGVFVTPPPLYDEAAESAVFSQIVATFTWLTTPTSTPAPGTGSLMGTVLASKPVTINVYDSENNVVGTGQVNPDGSFSFNAASGTNIVVASASGYLSAQRSVTITDGSTTTLPSLNLIPGDIDNNNVIDQFDAMTIGMNYNLAAPSAADLNNDGIINVLDLEVLAKNYRKTGPIVWE